MFHFSSSGSVGLDGAKHVLLFPLLGGWSCLWAGVILVVCLCESFDWSVLVLEKLNMLSFFH